MHVVLWDTRRLDVSKDFAGGFGVGMYPGGGGWRGRVIRRFYKRDYRPAALIFAYLAAIFRRLGHTVEYAEDRLPVVGDVYVFAPSLITLDLERQTIQGLRSMRPDAKILVVGMVAHVLSDMFCDLGATVVRGEAEQLLSKLDDVLQCDREIIDVGSVRDLDALPYPDWSYFSPHRFRIAYDFWKFPTGLVQLSRGCTFTCNYCPYIVVENKTRFREPESVAEEMRRGIEHYGFRSFKFRDPLFGLDRKRTLRMAEAIGRLPRKIQFSIESRIDLLRPETIRALHEVGLTSITVGIETPDEDTLRQYKRQPIDDDRQRQFVAFCRALGVRTVAGFMIGFPNDTAKSIRGVLKYAQKVNPTSANFNIVTPYPGTEFFDEVKEQIASYDFSKYSVYTPVLKYRHLTSEQVAELHAKCFVSYYFRWPFLRDNAHLLWPWLRKFGAGRKHRRRIEDYDRHSARAKAEPKPGELPILGDSLPPRRDPPHANAKPAAPNEIRVTRSDASDRR